MKLGKLSPKLIIGLLITIFFGVSLAFRTLPPFDTVFGGDWVRLTSIDGYFHMYIVDNLAHNFPTLTDFSPYFIFPGGSAVGNVYFSDWLLAGIIWIIGLGSPSQHTIDVVGVYFPAILAALTVIPVFFIGKALFNKWVGVLAAGLVAIFPGEYLGRSFLGFSDTPAVETLLTTTTIMFLILAIKTAGQRQLTISHLIRCDRTVIIKPLVYSLLAGLFMGIYLSTWLGGMLFIFIITIYFIIQFIIDHLRHRSSDHLGIVGFTSFLIALIIFLPFSPGGDLSIAIVLALLIPPILIGVSRLITSLGLKTVYYPLSVFGIGAVFLLAFYLIAPGMLDVIMDKFMFVFAPGGSTAELTVEMQPFLSPWGYVTTAVAYGNYTTSFFLIPTDWIGKNLWWFPGFAIIPIVISAWLFIKQRNNKQQLALRVLIAAMLIVALVFWFFTPAEWKMYFPGFAIISLITLICIYIIKRRDEEHWLLFFIWTVVILIATLVQRRFAYYLVVNVAVLSAYASWLIIWYAGIRKLEARSRETAEDVQGKSDEAQKQKGQEKSGGITIYHVNVAMAVIVVFFFVFFPNIPRAQSTASSPAYAPTEAWQSSLIWLKENTPEPLGDPDAYYHSYERDYEYPESAYGVTTWWDYGYWVTRIAHRIPSANPSQAPAPIMKVANLFLSQEESLAYEIMEELGSSYIIIDNVYAVIDPRAIIDPSLFGKFGAVPAWVGRTQGEFFEIYLEVGEDRIKPKILYYPEYYRSLLVRLFNFHGEAVTEVSPKVITYDEIADAEGNLYKLITSFKSFSSYQEALDYVESQEPANYRIVGESPFISPVPMETMENFNLIYSSETGVSYTDVGKIPEVKIFEYER